MNRHLLLALLVSFTVVGSVNASAASAPASQTPAPVHDSVYDMGVSRPMFVPEPLSMRRGFARKGATFTVSYTGFSDEAKAAFQKAVDIWSTLITSKIPIKVTARWEAMTEPNILGYCGPTSYSSDFQNAPKAGQWYAIALAESLANQELNGTKAEIDCAYNSNFTDWYLGTDGNCPADKIDFVTVILHELCHGLGFLSSYSYTTTDSKGAWGGGTTMPIVMDSYLYFSSTSGDKRLCDTANYKNPSKELGTAITSNSVIYNGLNTGKVYWYAPSVWQTGSSMSHVGEVYQGTPNALMCYQIARGVVIRNPGSIVMGVFADSGWPVGSTISGKIVASNGVGLSNMELAISPSIGSDTVRTDANGAYSFVGASSGTYIITPKNSSYSYEPTSKTVIVPPSSAQVNFVATSIKTIAADPLFYTINAYTGESIDSQRLSVWSTNPGIAVAYNISISYVSTTTGWLSVSPLAGISSGSPYAHDVFFNTTSLPAGDYSATITVKNPASAVSTINIPVRIIISDPITAMIGTSVKNSDVPLDLNVVSSFNVFNTGMNGTTLYFDVKTDNSWLVLTPTAASSKKTSKDITETVSINMSLSQSMWKYANYEANVSIYGYTDESRTVEVAGSPVSIPVVYQNNPSGIPLDNIAAAMSAYGPGITYDSKRAVAYWLDLSGVSTGVSQRVKAYKPTYVAESADAAGAPVILFGGKQALEFAKSYFINASDTYTAKSVCIVFKGDGLLIEQGGKNSGFAIVSSGGSVSATAWNQKNKNAVEPWGPVTASGSLASGYNCAVVTMDMATSMIYVYVNGALAGEASGFGKLSGDPAESASIGKVQKTTLSKFKPKPYSGAIGEVWYYNRALTTDEAAILSNNLLAMYQ